MSRRKRVCFLVVVLLLTEVFCTPQTNDQTGTSVPQKSYNIAVKFGMDGFAQKIKEYQDEILSGMSDEQFVDNMNDLPRDQDINNPALERRSQRRVSPSSAALEPSVTVLFETTSSGGNNSNVNNSTMEITCPAGAACRFLYTSQFTDISLLHQGNNTHLTNQTSFTGNSSSRSVSTLLTVYFTSRDIMTLSGCLATPFCQVTCTKVCVCHHVDGSNCIVIGNTTVGGTGGGGGGGGEGGSGSQSGSGTMSPSTNNVTLGPTTTAMTTSPASSPSKQSSAGTTSLLVQGAQSLQLWCSLSIAMVSSSLIL